MNSNSELEIIHEKQTNSEKEQTSHYIEEHHAELHKLINIKSDYLKDILDLEINK